MEPLCPLRRAHAGARSHQEPTAAALLDWPDHQVPWTNHPPPDEQPCASRRSANPVDPAEPVLNGLSNTAEQLSVGGSAGDEFGSGFSCPTANPRRRCWPKAAKLNCGVLPALANATDNPTRGQSLEPQLPFLGSTKLLDLEDVDVAICRSANYVPVFGNFRKRGDLGSRGIGCNDLGSFTVKNSKGWCVTPVNISSQPI